MNKIILIGNLTKDPDAIRTTSNGKDVCSFTIAVSRRSASKDSDQTTDYFRINAWGAKAKPCHDWLRKGKKVCAIGELNASIYTKDGKNYLQLNVNADEVEFLSPKGDPIASDPINAYMDAIKDIPEDEIPF